MDELADGTKISRLVKFSNQNYEVVNGEEHEIEIEVEEDESVHSKVMELWPGHDD